MSKLFHSSSEISRKFQTKQINPPKFKHSNNSHPSAPAMNPNQHRYQKHQNGYYTVQNNMAVQPEK